MKNIPFFIVVLLLFSCNHIQRGSDLSDTDIERMKVLKILDEGENVIKFYTEFKKQNAGNFFTNKRIATYWIDPRDKSKDQVYSAFYADVKSLDTVYNAGTTYSPYVLVTKKDGRNFKVCAGGKRKDIQSFFEDIITQWKAHEKDEHL